VCGLVITWLTSATHSVHLRVSHALHTHVSHVYGYGMSLCLTGNLYMIHGYNNSLKTETFCRYNDSQDLVVLPRSLLLSWL